nr:4Fe-4S dicluster-binding protein [uncultured Holophaga sp.]
MNVIKVDDEKCVGCKTCYKACWLDVIRWNEEAKRPVIAYAEDCVECNFCEISCPTDAIFVNVDYTRPFPSPYIPDQHIR